MSRKKNGEPEAFDLQADEPTDVVFSINEPPGSQIIPPHGELAPVAVLEDLDPISAVIGSEDVTLRCLGSGFMATDKIVFNGGEEPTTFVSDTELTTIVKPTLASVAGEYPVAVRNAAGDSNALAFVFEDELADEPTSRSKKRR